LIVLVLRPADAAVPPTLLLLLLAPSPLLFLVPLLPEMP